MSTSEKWIQYIIVGGEIPDMTEDWPIVPTPELDKE